ncbi:hypothetical protein [Oleiagrimonas sp. C23AA]|uniref:hypothetical protein n=1 Tax=Oleiagrimonas sp. C23AA TaxID=2719047 RepID=UPI001421B523|nr:hypothetical protein [Oleiagrimonas sp. C23AA]NII10896.1 hypothetical protein [Oleiagrimonas sp. C23AA]
MNDVIEFRSEAHAIPSTTGHRPSQRMTVHEFLKKLAVDDSFRSELETTPVASALAAGFTFDAQCLPKNGIKLPSKGEVKSYLDMTDERLLESFAVVIVFKI